MVEKIINKFYGGSKRLFKFSYGLFIYCIILYFVYKFILMVMDKAF